MKAPWWPGFCLPHSPRNLQHPAQHVAQRFAEFVKRMTWISPRIPTISTYLISPHCGSKLGSVLSAPLIISLTLWKWDGRYSKSIAALLSLSETPHRHLGSWLWYLSSVLVLWLISTTYYPKDHRIKLWPSVLWILTLSFPWHTVEN